MTDHKKDALKYSSAITAALIVLATAIGVFVYSMLKTTPGDLADVSVGVSENGTPALTPSGVGVPDHEPFVPAPTFPPPGE